LIKININEEQKKQIEELYWKDACDQETGIVKMLNRENVKSILRKDHEVIYKKFYDSNSELKVCELKKLLFSNRENMQQYIKEFGNYKYKPVLRNNLLEQVFRYDALSNRKVMIEVLRIIGIKVCPYCNRQYVTTLRSGKVRAQLDHYYCKSLYPYLAVSLYNLIPSCSVCNMAKSSLDTMDISVLYPYDEEFGYNTIFEMNIENGNDCVKVLQGLSEKFKIEIKSLPQEKNKESVYNQVERLRLEELYNEHKDYIKDIVRSHYVNTPDRIEELYSCFKNIFSSKDEIRGMIYMTDLDKESWGKRIMTKLTYDIEKQLNG